MEPEIELLLYILLFGGCFLLAWLIVWAGTGLVHIIKRRAIEREADHVAVLASRADIKTKLDLIDLQTQVIAPDKNGLYPVLRPQLDMEMAFRIALAQIESQRTFAPVPHTVTYSPQWGQKGELSMTEPAQIAAAMFKEVPGFSALFSNGTINKDKFLLGYTQEGDPMQGEIADVYSSLIVAKSGGGKTTLQRFLLAQAVMKGAKIWVADPHGMTDQGMVDALQPLRRHFACKPAIQDEEISELIQGFVAMGEARIHGQDTDKTIQILAVDELNDIALYNDDGPRIVAALIRAARAYRKVYMYVFASCQSINAEDLGGTTGIRKSFVGRFVLRSDKDAVNRLVNDRKLLEMVPTLEPGRSIFVPTRGAAIPLAIPNTTVQDLIFCFGNEPVAQFKAKPEGAKWQTEEYENTENNDSVHTSAPLVVEPLREPLSEQGSAPSGDLLSAKCNEAIRMFRSGESKSKIIADLWGVKGGDAFTKASAEFDNALRSVISMREN